MPANAGIYRPAGVQHKEANHFTPKVHKLVYRFLLSQE